MQQIELFLKEQYGIVCTKIDRMTTGVGGDTYRIVSDQGMYIFKVADANSINRPESEPKICNFLLQNQIAVSEFLANKAGNYVTSYGEDRYAHVQKYIEGNVYSMNEAPEWFMEQSAQILGNIHRKLQTYPELPVGIGKDFFYYMTVPNACQSYRKSLKTALERKEETIIEDLEFRIRFTESLPDMKFDVDKLTYRNTHGDFTVNQILCRDQRIQAVIDWTCACRHPVIWELTRSFFYAEPTCRDGALDENKFARYVNTYEELSPLNLYDKEQLLRLYYYQLTVCDYYQQYLYAEEHKKEEFLMQARFATNVLKNARIDL